jgi:uncharacterized protein (DUF1800 family)
MRIAGRSDQEEHDGVRHSAGLGYQKTVGTLRAALAFSLCLLTIDQPLMGANVVKRGPTAGVQGKGEDRIVHALNRLTFGPRPGDVAAVQAIGLSTWFDMQLNPAKIDDSALQARLAQFPAMQMAQDELMFRYPSQQTIRQMEQKGGSLPLDPLERAIYGDQLAFYKVQKAKQAAKDAAAAAVTDANATAGDSMTANGMPASGMVASGTVSSGTAAPIVRRAPGSAASATAAGGDGMAAAAGGSSDAMAGDLAAANEQAAALLKQDFADAGVAPDEHVEQLYNDADAMKILSLPPDERMRRVLAMAPNDFVAFRQSLSGGELGEFLQGLTPQQKEIFAAMQNSTRMVGAEEMEVRLLRDIYSDRQLEAVMNDFWLNHFNVYVRKNQNEPYLIPAYERDAIRPNALGKFEDLLVATAKSPAMLMYLDNWQSIGPDSLAAKNAPKLAKFVQNPQVKAALKDRGLNENYGRELMELHTLGVNGGYTQQDVTEVAKVFTGWTITPPAQGGEFQFDERKHEPGPKTVLGKTIQENGMNEGLQVLHMLATSPATARFISTKLAVRFVSDDPPQTLVDRMTQSFLASDGDIKTVLRTMFESPEFWAPAAQRAKVKTPLEFVVSAVRASGAQVNHSLGLVQALDRLGMPLYGMQTPNGYSWMSEPWVSTGALVSRMNFALVLTGDKLPGVRTDWTKLLGEPGVAGRPVAMESGDGVVDPEVAAKEKRLEHLLLEEPLSEKTRAAVLSQSNDQTAAMQAAKEFQVGGGGYRLGGLEGAAAGQKNAAPEDRQAAIMAGLMLGSPEFQRR